MDVPRVPSYVGRGLVNLVAEIEHRLTGTAPSPTLDPDLAHFIPSASTYVVVLFDGLGAHQLNHPNASDLAAASAGVLDAPFPATTTVSLATVATGLPPSQHGLIGYKMWMPDLGSVVNTIHMTTPTGESIADLDAPGLLPSPNLWERLSASGIGPVVVQPGNFASTPLTTALYRGARFEGYWNLDDVARVTTDIAAIGERLVFVYVPDVDFAAHIAGQKSEQYDQAMVRANTIWASLTTMLPPDVCLIGTADHGHIDIDETSRHLVDAKDLGEGFVSEDGRVLFVHGDGSKLAARHGGSWLPLDDGPGWWGPEPMHASFVDRRPAGIVFLPEGTTVFNRESNRRLVGYHGGASPVDIEIPLLVRASSVIRNP
ncbi:MAG: hypothetical protein DWP92_10195 [Armatimonadetes bacterium]|nr:MAG: hypothetical protein DWP92_10195 [Armatimonadota bacterium]